MSECALSRAQLLACEQGIALILVLLGSWSLSTQPVTLKLARVRMECAGDPSSTLFVAVEPVSWCPADHLYSEVRGLETRPEQIQPLRCQQ